MTAADNEELDALLRELDNEDYRVCDRAATAIRALRARVAEAERLTEAALAAQESTTELLRAAESQLRQVKADAERTSEENELLRLRMIHLQEQLQEPPRTETANTWRNDGT